MAGLPHEPGHSTIATNSQPANQLSHLASKESEANSLVQQGQYEKAEAIYVAVLADRQAADEDNLRDILIARMNLALLYGRLGRNTEAKDILRDVVSKSEQKFGLENVDTMKAMDNLAISLHKLGKIEEGKEIQMQTVAFFRSHLGEKDATTLSALSNLAITYRSEKQYEKAHDTLLLVHHTMNELYGESDQRSLAAMCDLGLSFLHKGEIETALKMKSRLISVFEASSMKCTVDTITSILSFAGAFRESRQFGDARQLMNLALQQVDALQLGEDNIYRLDASYRSAVLNVDCSCFNEAEPVLKEIADLNNQAFGMEHTRTLEVNGELMRCYMNKGDYHAAQGLAIELIPKFKKTLGHNNDKTITTMLNLALLYRLQSQYDEAHNIIEETLELVLRHFIEHRIHVRALQEYSVLLRHMQKLDEAVKLHLETIELSEKVYGKTHVDTFLAMTSLSNTYAEQGRVTEAINVAEQVLLLRRQALGVGHLDTISTMSDLIILFERADDLSSAERLQLQLLEVKKDLRGPYHDETLQEMEFLVEIYHNQGKKQALRDLRLQIYEANATKFGKLHPKAMESLLRFANSHHQCGDFDKFEASFRQLVNDRSQAYGPEATETLAAIEDLATALQQQERYDDAIELQSRLVEIRKRILGVDNLDTLRAMSVLMQIRDDKGDLDLDEGERNLRDILAARIKILGTEDDLRIALTLNFLAKILASKGELEEAKYLWEKVLDIRERHLGSDHPATEHTRSVLEALDEEYESEE